MAASSNLSIPSNLEPAYQECIQLARSHYENFTVVARFLSKDVLPHLSAIYAYCRGVDDLGDEAEGDRLVLLEDWARDFELCYSGTPEMQHIKALQHTIHTYNIPPEPFRMLTEANRMDQRTQRYETFEELLNYCNHSANPVGHLYLYVLGYRDEERHHLSDFTCTGLQLANFWQDINRDFAMGRIYLPKEDMSRFGYTEEDLASGVCNAAFQELMAFQVERTRQYFERGSPLVRMVEGQARLHIKLFSLGGLRVLDAIHGQGYDVLSKRPVVSRWRKAWLLSKTLLRMKLTRQI